LRESFYTFVEILNRPGEIPSSLLRWARFEWMAMVVREFELAYFKSRNQCLVVHQEILYQVKLNTRPQNGEGGFILYRVENRTPGSPANELSGNIFEEFVEHEIVPFPFVNEPPRTTWVPLTMPGNAHGVEITNVTFYSVFNGLTRIPFTPAQLFNENWTSTRTRVQNTNPLQ
jgi:hypothetical protein